MPGKTLISLFCFLLLVGTLSAENIIHAKEYKYSGKVNNISYYFFGGKKYLSFSIDSQPRTNLLILIEDAVRDGIFKGNPKDLDPADLVIDGTQKKGKTKEMEALESARGFLKGKTVKIFCKHKEYLEEEDLTFYKVIKLEVIK